MPVSFNTFFLIVHIVVEPASGTHTVFHRLRPSLHHERQVEEEV
jgi:hypothetical protein